MYCPFCGRELQVDQQEHIRRGWITMVTCPHDDCPAPYWTGTEETMRSGDVASRYNLTPLYCIDTGILLADQVSSNEA